MSDATTVPPAQRFVPPAAPPQQPPRPVRSGDTAAPIEQGLPALEPGFGSLASFTLLQRQATALSRSTQIPFHFRHLVPKWNKRHEEWPLPDDCFENQNAVPNCMVALNIANRMKADVISVMWNLDIIEGRPSWRGQYVIALVNGSKLFQHPLRFRMSIDEVDKPFKYYDRDGTERSVLAKPFTCVAYTKTPDGETVESEPITMEMVVAEGWYQKKGSKWRTMLGQMAKFRAGSFFARVHCPHLLFGLPEADELQDIIDAKRDRDGTWNVSPEVEGRAEPAPEPAPAAAATSSEAPKADPQQSEAAGAEGASTPLLTADPARQTVSDLLAGLGGSNDPAQAQEPEPALPPKREPVRRRFAPME